MYYFPSFLDELRTDRQSRLLGMLSKYLLYCVYKDETWHLGKDILTEVPAVVIWT